MRLRVKGAPSLTHKLGSLREGHELPEEVFTYALCNFSLCDFFMTAQSC